NLVLDSLETKITVQPLFWARFIDDVFAIIDNDDDVPIFCSQYNSLHDNIKVKFITSKLSVNYMDLTILIENNKIEYKIFQKPMSTFQYIPFNSYHKQFNLYS